MSSIKVFYQEKLKRCKTTSSKKAFITKTINEVNSTLEEARSCNRFYLGESKYKAIMACKSELTILTDLQQNL